MSEEKSIKYGEREIKYNLQYLKERHLQLLFILIALWLLKHRLKYLEK